MSGAVQLGSGSPFQLGYVVEDMAAAEKYYRDQFGVEKFHHMPGIEFAEGCEFGGQPADFVADICIAYCGDQQIEFIKPVSGESLYADFLAERGPGLHHLAYLTDNFEHQIAQLKQQGESVHGTGVMAGGLMKFGYVNPGGLGTYIELMELSHDMKNMFDYMIGDEGVNPWNR